MRKKWTLEEIQFLKANYQEKGSKFCADKLGRNRHTIKSKARSLKIAQKRTHKAWSQKEIDFLIINYPEKGWLFCANELGVLGNLVKQKVKHLKIKLKCTSKIWIEEDIRFLKENYPEKGNEYCAKMLGRSRKAVRTKACEIKIKTKIKFIHSNETYSVNPEQFFQINTKEIAYLLGLLWADGHVSNHETTKRHSIILAINQNDFKTIEPILDSTGKWAKFINKPKYGHWLPIVHATISNTPINQFLKQHNYCTKHENATIIEIIPDHLLKYFLRGYHDGDGCFCMTKGKQRISFAGPYEQDWTFMENISNKLQVEKFCIARNIRKDDSKESIFYISRKTEVKKMLDFIYSDYDGLGFPRKYQKYLNFIKILSICPVKA